jgi:hypothetical protein
MNTFILVLVLSVGGSYQTGTSSVVQEFNSESTCITALSFLLKDSQGRDNFVLTSGCFKK